MLIMQPDTKKRKRDEYSPGDDLPPAKTATDQVVIVRKKNVELQKENENLKQEINEMSDNIRRTDNEIKAMNEEKEFYRSQMAKYEEKISSMMDDLMRGQSVIEKLEEVIRSKDALIQDCSEHHQKKAANEDTYTQAIGQSSGRLVSVPALPRGAESVSTRAQENPRRQDLSLIHISEPTRPY